LIRRERDGPLVLMGQRHRAHQFMPNKFVFPGGRIDRADSLVTPAAELRPEIEAKLLKGCSAARARAIAMAAIRETFEETGLLVGRRTNNPPRTRSKSWAAFAKQGVAPRLDILDLVARAITPPGERRRFDARFFMADAEHVQGSVDEDLAGSGELLDLDWIPLSQARALDLPGITRLVVGEIEERLASPLSERRVPFVHHRHGRPIFDYL
jgi:8-oxo-dGTP pyrophosphatase MutT (NUDIX family)